MKKSKIFLAGIIKENPTLVLVLGTCPTLATTTSLDNAIGMGFAVLAVLILSNAIISAIRNSVPNEIRIPVYIIIVASIVSIIQMLMQAYTPVIFESLGIFLPLIVVNCIILGRAEAFASKNTVLDSIFDALGMGLGFICALLLISLVRQTLGTGVWSLSNPFNPKQIFFSLTVLPKEFTIDMFVKPYGAFLSFGLVIAAVAAVTNAINDRKAAQNKEGVK